MIRTEITFRTGKSSLMKDSFIKEFSIFKFDGNKYSTLFSYDEMIYIVEKILSKINETKTELFLELKFDNSYSKVEFQIISILINKKIFCIHRHVSGNSQPEFDFTDSKYRRKAKLLQATTGYDYNPEKLWNESWYNSLYNNNRYKINYV